VHTPTTLAVLALLAVGCSGTEPQLASQASVTVLGPGPLRSYQSTGVVWGLFPGYAFDRQIEIRLPSDIGVPNYISPRLYLLAVCRGSACVEGVPRAFSAAAESTATAWLDTWYGVPGVSLLPVTFGADSGTITLTTATDWTTGTFDVWVQDLHLRGTYVAETGTPDTWRWGGTAAAH
jgi:hypothetical protein